jgi:cbb3-type cytochrome oxidase subunit 1
MTRLSVWTVRAALLYLGAGFFLGALMLTQKGLPIDPALLRLLPLHIEIVLLGWTLQLAMGIAFWILPRFSHEPRYGNQTFGWLAFVLLNVGVLCAGLGQSLGVDPSVALLGRLAEACAVIFFLGHAWPRVRPVGL